MRDFIHCMCGMALVFAGAGVARGQAAPPAVDAPIAARRVVGGGSWRSDGRAARTAQRWDLQLSRGAGDALTGRVTLQDSPLLSTGTVHARIVGRNVAGFVADEAGNRALTFRGTIEADRMSGTYTDRTGETGAWAWDGPPPQYAVADALAAGTRRAQRRADRGRHGAVGTVAGGVRGAGAVAAGGRVGAAGGGSGAGPGRCRW